MRTKFNNNELAHIWAAQSQNEGTAGSFYFRGNTIYSYGSHFPIATMVGHDVLFTKRTYSNTTAKHIGLTRRAISHKNLIYCYDVPVNLSYATTEHENNLNRWKREINSLFNELGNKKIRDIQSRVNGINSLINELNTYCQYFKLKVKDSELKTLLKLAASPDFIEQARAAKEKANIAAEKKMKQANKAYEIYLKLWRAYDTEGLNNMPDNIKTLCRYYSNNAASFTHLRYNAAENRLETSKGVQIPAEIAKRAYIQLNGCIEGKCDSISVPVMGYTITKTTNEAIIAGCHTIPKTDIKYIATLLNWN